jgi:1-aminocyclopropane-1-carboxylate deaminase
LLEYKPIIQKISSDLFSEKEIEVSVLRLDLIHPEISGNKWFKLKYNLEEAKKQGLYTILTFGGAFSNHIHAAAVSCKEFGFKSIGVIRGEKESESNSTLSEAKKYGMQLHFVSREKYKQKESKEFVEQLKKQFGNFYLIPEGGDNSFGEKGCEEILSKENNFDHIFCACGTGTTFKGISKSLKPNQKLIGISVLKGEPFGKLRMTEKDSEIITDYHFGGYAKHTNELLEFKNKFESENNIPLDHVYTSKLFYAVTDLISKNKIPKNSKVLIIHSGGLQGNAGYEKRYFLKPNLNVKEPQG